MIGMRSTRALVRQKIKEYFVAEQQNRSKEIIPMPIAV